MHNRSNSNFQSFFISSNSHYNKCLELLVSSAVDLPENNSHESKMGNKNIETYRKKLEKIGELFNKLSPQEKLDFQEFNEKQINSYLDKQTSVFRDMQDKKILSGLIKGFVLLIGGLLLLSTSRKSDGNNESILVALLAFAITLKGADIFNSTKTPICDGINAEAVIAHDPEKCHYFNVKKVTYAPHATRLKDVEFKEEVKVCAIL